MQWAAGLVLGMLLLSGCGGSGEHPPADAAAAQPVSANSPTIHVPPGPPPGDVVVKDLQKGKGAAVPPITNTARVKITALYKAVNYETGDLYEERWDPKDPYEVEVDPSLDAGWEAGLPGLKVGGLRQMIVPASMSFHEVPLVYLIKLLRVEKIGSASNAGLSGGRTGTQGPGLAMSKQEIAKLPKLTIAKQSGPPPHHLKIVDLRKGTGATVTKRDAVTIRYLQALYPEVRKRSRTGRFGPLKYGLDETVKGVALGLLGMKVGGRRELILPPKLAYPSWKPSWGYAPYVRVYLIDLIRLEPGGAAE
jgi:peptidylprolyl isomerase